MYSVVNSFVLGNKAFNIARGMKGDCGDDYAPASKMAVFFLFGIFP